MRVVFSALTALVAVVESTASYGQQNAPEANRKAVAELIRSNLAQELDGKEFPARTAGKIKVAVVEVDAAAEARMTFVEPKKTLVANVPSLQNRGKEGMRLTAEIAAPLRASLAASAEGIRASGGLTATAVMEVEADVKLQPAKEGKWKAEIVIQKLDGRLEKLDVGDAGANAVLRPILSEVANKVIEANREQLKGHANAALKKAAEEGRLHFNF